MGIIFTFICFPRHRQHLHICDHDLSLYYYLIVDEGHRLAAW